MKGWIIISNYKNDTRSRGWFLTINNAVEHGYTHEHINDIMKGVKYLYYCLCDEISTTQTPHTHLYFKCEHAMYFSRVKKLFPTADIEEAKGSSQDCRDYIRKEGRYIDSEKKETNLIETFKEYGDIPLDKSTKNTTVSEQVLRMIEDGCSDYEIINRHPSWCNKTSQLIRLRQVVLNEKYSNVERDIEVTYMFGLTGTGKSTYVHEKYGYKDVFTVSNYEHPFDDYKGQPILFLDEFGSQLRIRDVLNYLHKFPCRLPARYADLWACYTKVFIASNLPLEKQYINIQAEDPNTWNAFVRRIHNVWEFVKNEDMPFETSGFNSIITHNINDYYRG